MPDEPLDEPEDLDHPPSFFPYDREEVEGLAPSEPNAPVACRVDAVYAAQSGENIQRFVLLSDGHRKLPIVIGGYEATAITLPLEGQQPDRPMTHDLLKSIMDRAGVTLQKVVIDDLWGTTYYAKVYLKFGKEETAIDARPSDAIALAVRCDAPIFVMETILEHHGN